MRCQWGHRRPGFAGVHWVVEVDWVEVLEVVDVCRRSEVAALLSEAENLVHYSAGARRAGCESLGWGRGHRRCGQVGVGGCCQCQKRRVVGHSGEGVEGLLVVAAARDGREVLINEHVDGHAEGRGRRRRAKPRCREVRWDAVAFADSCAGNLEVLADGVIGEVGVLGWARRVGRLCVSRSAEVGEEVLDVDGLAHGRQMAPGSMCMMHLLDFLGGIVSECPACGRDGLSQAIESAMKPVFQDVLHVLGHNRDAIVRERCIRGS